MAISDIKVQIIKRNWVVIPVFTALKFLVWAGVKNERVIGAGVDIIAKYGYRMKI